MRLITENRIIIEPNKGEVKTFVLLRPALFDQACFMTPSDVADAVKEEFNIEISRQLVRTYNPEQNPDIAQERKTLFEATRKKYIEQTAAHGVAHQAYRLERIQGR